MELGIKKPKINLNYRVSESGSSDKNIRRDYSERNIVLSPEDIRKKNNQNSLKKQGSNYSSNGKLIFDPKKYVNFFLNLLIIID